MRQPEFDPAELHKNMPQSAQDAVILLLRTWVLFEVALTDWLTAIAGMRDDIGMVLIGRMDTRTKITKLTEIYSRLQNRKQVITLKKLGKSNEGYSKIRNTVVHTIYMGYRGSPENYELIFATHRPTKDEQGRVDAVIVRLDDLKKTAEFAASSAKKINDAVQVWRRRSMEGV